MVIKLSDSFTSKRDGKIATGLFIDGISLDRASKRMGRKVSLENLLNSFKRGHEIAVARYYTVIPQEDDSRHRSFLDAVAKSGFEVIVKRLPPKGVNRQVTSDLELTTDMFAFACGKFAPDVTPSVIVVCPSHDLAYPFTALKERGVITTAADFGANRPGDVLKSAEDWIDLSDAEEIWIRRVIV